MVYLDYNSMVILFHNSSSAIRAEALLKRAGIPSRLIPTPRELSSDCGVALRFTRENKEEIASILGGAKVETAGIFEAPK